MVCRCVVGGCSNIKSEKVALHRYPSNISLWPAWDRFVRTTRKDFNKGHTRTIVCSDHFKEEHFENLIQWQLGGSKNLLLKKTAIPSRASVSTLTLHRPTILRPVKKPRKNRALLIMKLEMARMKSSFSTRKRSAKKRMADITAGDTVVPDFVRMKKERFGIENKPNLELLAARESFHDVKHAFPVKSEPASIYADSQHREDVFTPCTEEALLGVKTEVLDPEDQINMGFPVPSSCRQPFCNIKPDVVVKVEPESSYADSQHREDVCTPCAEERLLAVKTEVFDPEDQINMGFPVPSSSRQPFCSVKPPFLSRAVSELDSSCTQSEQYRKKCILVFAKEKFRVELNPEWSPDDEQNKHPTE